MNMRYNDKTGSLQYLVTDEATLKSKWTLCQPFSYLRRVCFQLSGDRLILILALVMAAMAVVLSFCNFVRLHNIQINKDNVKDFSTNALHGVDPSYYLHDEDIEELKHSNLSTFSPSGSGPRPTTQPPSSLTIHSLLEILEVLNASVANWKELQISRLQTLKENIERRLSNETLGINHKVKVLNDSHRNYEHYVNESLSKLSKTQQSQNDAGKRQEDWAQIQNELNNKSSSGIKRLQNQMQLLNTTMEDQRKRTQRVSQDVTDLATKLENITSTANIAVLSLENRVAEMTRKLDDARTNLTKVTEVKSETLQDLTGHFQSYVSHTNRQLNLIRSDISRMKTNQARTALAFGSRVKNASSAVAAQSAEAKDYLEEVKTRLRRLEQRSEVHSASLVRDDARFDTLTTKSRRLSIILDETTRALKRKADAGWIQGPNGCSYYITQHIFRSWSSAKRHCEGLNSTLAFRGPRNKAMQKFLFANLIEPRGVSAWIGLSDIVEEATWKWIDGDPLIYSNWASGQPNNLLSGHVSGQDCVEIDKRKGEWNDLWCIVDKQSANVNVALCEKMTP